jgi:hypothetical protein
MREVGKWAKRLVFNGGGRALLREALLFFGLVEGKGPFVPDHAVAKPNGAGGEVLLVFQAGYPASQEEGARGVRRAVVGGSGAAHEKAEEKREGKGANHENSGAQ